MGCPHACNVIQLLNSPPNKEYSIALNPEAEYCQCIVKLHVTHVFHGGDVPMTQRLIESRSIGEHAASAVGIGCRSKGLGLRGWVWGFSASQDLSCSLIS